MKHRLVPQLYGIATAGNVFGGPRGVWLECTSCAESRRMVGHPDPMEMSDKEVAAFYRRNGWTGVGDKMKSAKCLECSK